MMSGTLIKQLLFAILFALSLGFTGVACTNANSQDAVVQKAPVTAPPPTTSQPDLNGTFTIVFAVEGKGTISPSPGPHIYNAGDIVTISATEVPDWVFNTWLGNVPNNLSKATTITVTGDQTITAYFSVIACYLDF
jgi:hypothetical protein